MGDKKMAHRARAANVEYAALIFSMLFDVFRIGGRGLARQPVGLDVRNGDDGKFESFGGVQGHYLDTAFF